MSIKDTPSLEKDQAVEAGEDHSTPTKRRRLQGCFPFMEISMEPGKSLKDVDDNKFKEEIKRWAKRVVEYARQLSGRLGSSRKSGRIGSSSPESLSGGSRKIDRIGSSSCDSSGSAKKSGRIGGSSPDSSEDSC